ncbi:MAG: hypothetical protein ACRDJO_13360 [Actinomycetota bacterium]
MNLTGEYARAHEDELHRQSEHLRLVREATAASRKARHPSRRRAAGLGGALRRWFDAGQLGPVSRRADTDRY